MNIDNPNPVACWQEASRHLLLQGGEDFNLVATFSASEAENEEIMREFNPAAIKAGADSIYDVANTIFPLRTYLNAKAGQYSREAFYSRYKRAHRRGNKKAWGTYFRRFIELGESHANQLEIVIQKRRSWAKNFHSALYLHVTSMEIDRPRPRGGPCLQYVQFCCRRDGQVDLVALYRNHDYFNKALGNYFGLSRLLRFFCTEAGGQIGTVSCIGVHAFAGTKNEQRKLAQL